MFGRISTKPQPTLTKAQQKQYCSKGSVLGGALGATTAPMATAYALKKLYPDTFTSIKALFTTTKNIKPEHAKELYKVKDILNNMSLTNIKEFIFKDKTNLKESANLLDTLYQSFDKLKGSVKSSKGGVIALGVATLGTTVYIGAKIGNWAQNKVMQFIQKYNPKKQETPKT